LAGQATKLPASAIIRTILSKTKIFFTADLHTSSVNSR
jgi:hypothetical protein